MIPASLLAIWLAIATLIIYPDFLAYFNVLAGGPDNGWHSLVDSNLDWGQDLDDLPGWMAENDVEKVWLSYFGEARPDYYGISYEGLDSFPPRLMNPQARPFFPGDPSPGIYAISATNLQGVLFTNHEQFAWFREQEPIGKLGYSIFLYEVPANGEPLSLLLSGIQLDEIHPEDFGKFESNDITPRWIDLSQSLIVPADSNIWLVSNTSNTSHPAFDAYLNERFDVEARSSEYQLGRYHAPKLPDDVVMEFSLENGRIQLQNAAAKLENETELTVVTTWEQKGEPQPLKIFIHVVDPNGDIISQWDGLGAAWEGWREGDKLVQVHEITLPKSIVKGSSLIAGLYDPETGRRWLTDQNVDHIELELPQE